MEMCAGVYCQLPRTVLSRIVVGQNLQRVLGQVCLRQQRGGPKEQNIKFPASISRSSSNRNPAHDLTRWQSATCSCETLHFHLGTPSVVDFVRGGYAGLQGQHSSSASRSNLPRICSDHCCR